MTSCNNPANGSFRVTGLGLVSFLLVVALAAGVSGCGRSSFTVEEHLERGLNFEQQGQLAAASIEYRNALQQDPSNAQGRYRLGMLLLRSGDGAGAEGELTRARELGVDPDDLRLPLLRAWLLMGRHELVLEATRDVESFPESHVAEALAHRAMALMAKDDVSAAQETLDAALGVDAGQADALFGMAWVEILSGRPDAALPWIGQALAARPGFSRAFELKGDLEWRAGRHSEAEEAFSDAVKTSFDPLSPQLKRAVVRMLRQDFQGAHDDLTKLERRYRNNPLVFFGFGLSEFLQGDYANAQAQFEQALAADNEYMPAVLYLGTSYLYQGNWRQAEQQLSRFVRRFPQATDATRLLAQARLGAGDSERAERWLKSVLEREPEDRAALAMVTHMYLNEGRTAEALPHLRRMTDLEPDSVANRTRLALALLGEGQREDALKELEAARAIDPSEVTGLDVAIVVNHIAARQFEQALQAAERLRDEGGAEPMIYFNLIGIAQLGLNNLDAAENAFRQGLEDDPGNRSLSMNLGMLELRRGNREAAKEVFEALQARHPGHADSAIRLAQLEMLEGNFTGARRWLSDAIAYHPEVAELQYRLAEVLAAGQDHREAEQALRRTLELDPDHLMARVVLVDRLSMTGRVREARLLFEPLLEDHPDEPVVLAQQGWFQLQDGDYEGSVISFRRALEVQTRRSWLMHYHQAQLLAGQEEAALATLTDWLERQPDDSGVRRLLGSSLLYLNREDEALEVFREQVRRQPEDATALNNLAWLLRERNPAEALEYAQRAYALAPKRAEVLNTLGVAFLYTGDTKRAVETLQRARDAAPNAPAIGVHLARALHADGQTDRARGLLETILAQHEAFRGRDEAEGLLREIRGRD
jgi:cellulose synthase operon protein C